MRCLSPSPMRTEAPPFWRDRVADRLTPEQRRLNMSRVRSRDTAPELLSQAGTPRARLPLSPAPPRSAWTTRYCPPKAPRGRIRERLLLARPWLLAVPHACHASGFLGDEDRRQPRTRRGSARESAGLGMADPGRLGVCAEGAATSQPRRARQRARRLCLRKLREGRHRWRAR